MDYYELLGHDGKMHKARVLKKKSDLVFSVTWSEKDSKYTKLIDLQDLEMCNK